MGFPARLTAVCNTTLRPWKNLRARGVNRTRGPTITSGVLCQLSYTSIRALGRN
jgi:hypothetical protein